MTVLTKDQLTWARRFTGLRLADAPERDDETPPADAAADCHTDKLPQPMLPDCKIVRGVVPAPDNFVLCAMHGHILDTDTKQIVAHSLKEFEAQHPEFGALPQPMAADCTPDPGKLKGPDNHVLCRTHGHVLDVKAKQIIAYSAKDYAKRFPSKKPEAAAGKPTPASKEHTRQSLKDLLTGTAILVAEFQNRAPAAAKALGTLAGGPANLLVSDAQKALATAETALHTFSAAAGEFIADFDVAAPTKVPKACQDARVFLHMVSTASIKLGDAIAKPQAAPKPEPKPDGIDDAAWKAQQELVRRRDALAQGRDVAVLQADVLSLLDASEKLQMELDTAQTVAMAVLAK